MAEATVSKDEANSFATVKSVGLLSFGGSLLSNNIVLLRSLETIFAKAEVYD